MTTINEYLKLSAGLVSFKLSGKTPDWAYQSLISLFCRTGGRANQQINKILTLGRSRYNLQDEPNIIEPSEAKFALDALNSDGFYIFKKKLPESMCAELEALARTAKVTIHPCAPHSSGFYRDKRPDTETMRLNETDLLADPTVRSIVGDAGLISLAQDYLGPQPRLDHVGMWWSIARQGDPSKEGAQEYHFDLDRIRFVQFFVYLTDCETNDGPHCFVRGTHRPERTSRELLARGYARIPDEDVRERFPADDLVEITGSRGTIFAVDTLAFHKGKQPTNHDRLVLQIVMCSSLFGANKPAHKVSIAQADALSRAASSCPRYLDRFETH